MLMRCAMKKRQGRWEKVPSGGGLKSGVVRKGLHEVTFWYTQETEE